MKGVRRWGLRKGVAESLEQSSNWKFSKGPGCNHIPVMPGWGTRPPRPPTTRGAVSLDCASCNRNVPPHLPHLLPVIISHPLCQVTPVAHLRGEGEEGKVEEGGGSVGKDRLVMSKNQHTIFI